MSRGRVSFSEGFIMRRIYLDYAATTPVDPQVVTAMAPFLSETFGNPSSTHSFGQESRKALEEARQVVADSLGAARDDLFFTSGGTEANNLAVFGVARANKDRGRHLITTVIEHHSVLHSFHCLEKEGFHVTYIPVTESGIVDTNVLMSKITSETILVSVMHANNEIGTIQPIEKIANFLREKGGIVFHVDGVQAFPHLPVNVTNLGVDLYSISSHKMYGPKGVGALYIKKGVMLEPLFAGGGQERGIRPGTENLAAIVGFGSAVKILLEKREKENKRIALLRDNFLEVITSKIDGVFLNGDPGNRLPNNVNLSFEWIDGEALAIRLDLEGIACSTGSACSSGGVLPSHVINAICGGKVNRHSAVRFTFGRQTTQEEVEKASEIICNVVKELRENIIQHCMV